MLAFMALGKDFFSLKIGDIFLKCAPNIDCGCLLEPPHRRGSNEYPPSMLWRQKKQNSEYPGKPHFILYKVFFFLGGGGEGGSGGWGLGCSLHGLVKVMQDYSHL